MTVVKGDSLLQGILFLLVHLCQDLVLLLQDLELVFDEALLALDGGDGVLQLLVFLCTESTPLHQ